MLIFPDYDGNGMFRSLGNIRVNPHVGLLFIRIGDKPGRLRINGTARIAFEDERLQSFAGAITVDSRGHGRSSRDAQPFGYDLMAADVLALMDRLRIASADILGWSDGAIIGLDIALRHPERIRALFAFAANADPSGVREDLGQSANFNRFIARAGDDYRRLSRTPGDYDSFVKAISTMWATQPRWTAADLRTIRVRTLIADGDHDEAIKRAHTEMLAAEIPNASLLILPGVSHFAMLQDPTLFNAAALDFFAEHRRPQA